MSHFSSLFRPDSRETQTKKPIKHSACHHTRRSGQRSVNAGASYSRETTKHKKENGKLRRRRCWRRQRWQRRPKKGRRRRKYSLIFTVAECINEYEARAKYGPRENAVDIGSVCLANRITVFHWRSLLLFVARCLLLVLFVLCALFQARVTHTEIFVYSTSYNPPHRTLSLSLLLCELYAFMVALREHWHEKTDER